MPWHGPAQHLLAAPGRPGTFPRRQAGSLSARPEEQRPAGNGPRFPRGSQGEEKERARTEQTAPFKKREGEANFKRSPASRPNGPGEAALPPEGAKAVFRTSCPAFRAARPPKNGKVPCSSTPAA